MDDANPPLENCLEPLRHPVRGSPAQAKQLVFPTGATQNFLQALKLREAGSSLNFLGYTFRYDRDLQGRPHRYLNIFPSRKAMEKARETIRDLTSPQRCFLPVVQMIGQINVWSTGWTNYFGYGYPRVAFRSMHNFIVNRVTNHLRRRSQRAYRPPVDKSFYAHVHDLGLKRL